MAIAGMLGGSAERWVPVIERNLDRLRGGAPHDG